MPGDAQSEAHVPRRRTQVLEASMRGMAEGVGDPLVELAQSTDPQEPLRERKIHHELFLVWVVVRAVLRESDDEVRSAAADVRVEVACLNVHERVVDECMIVGRPSAHGGRVRRACF